MRLKLRKIFDGPGMGPGERLVIVRTATGRDEEVIVHETSVVGQELEVGYPVHRDGNKYLVELPRESMTGSWRIWVSGNQLVPAA